MKPFISDGTDNTANIIDILSDELNIKLNFFFFFFLLLWRRRAGWTIWDADVVCFIVIITETLVFLFWLNYYYTLPSLVYLPRTSTLLPTSSLFINKIVYRYVTFFPYRIDRFPNEKNI